MLFSSKRCRLPEVLADSHCFFGTERQSMLWPCPRFDKETMQYRAVSLWFWYDSASLFAVFGILFHEKTRQSYTSEGREGNPTPILHPILHPKLPVNTGCVDGWCRKCRNFFQKKIYGRASQGCFPKGEGGKPEIKNIGLL